MKNLFITVAIAMILNLGADFVFAQSYCQDFLEPGNPGGMTTGLKTCDTVNPVEVDPGDTFTIDIWATDVPPPDLTAGLITSGFKMVYNPTAINIVSVQAYDGVDIDGGFWDGAFTIKVPDPGSYSLLLAQFTCAVPDAGGDVILAKATFRYLSNDSANITLGAITNYATTVGCSNTVYDLQMGIDTITINTAPDSDKDAVPDHQDNCPNHPNGQLLGTCTSGPREKIGIAPCTSNTDCDPNGFCSMNQEDIYPPGGNGVGDACDCEGNFDCDGDVDGTDAVKFKEDFGRNVFKNPCPNCK